VSAELGEIREAHQVLEETFAAAGRAHAQLVEQLVGEREKATAGQGEARTRAAQAAQARDSAQALVEADTVVTIHEQF